MKIPISEAALSLGFTGGTKEGELQRTAEVLIQISEREQGNGPYYIIALLYDLGYGRGMSRGYWKFCAKSQAG